MTRWLGLAVLIGFALSPIGCDRNGQKAAVEVAVLQQDGVVEFVDRDPPFDRDPDVAVVDADAFVSPVERTPFDPPDAFRYIETDESIAHVVLIVETLSPGATEPTERRFPYFRETFLNPPPGIQPVSRSSFPSADVYEDVSVTSTVGQESKSVTVRISTSTLDTKSRDWNKAEAVIVVPWMGETPWIVEGGVSFRGRFVGLRR